MQAITQTQIITGGKKINTQITKNSFFGNREKIQIQSPTGALICFLQKHNPPKKKKGEKKGKLYIKKKSYSRGFRAEKGKGTPKRNRNRRWVTSRSLGLF